MEYIATFVMIIVISLYFYYIDPNQEPLKRLAEAFILGFAISLQVDWLQNFIPAIDNIAYISFIHAGLIEEGVKLLVINLTLFRNRYFTQKVDGITYAVFLSLGFALAENLVLIQDVGTGIVRAFTAVPAHALFAVSMGFYVGKFKFLNKKQYLLLALIVPVLLHGVYNLLIFSQSFWGLIIFIPYIVFLWVKATKQHERLKIKGGESNDKLDKK